MHPRMPVGSRRNGRGVERDMPTGASRGRSRGAPDGNRLFEVKLPSYHETICDVQADTLLTAYIC